MFCVEQAQCIINRDAVYYSLYEDWNHLDVFTLLQHNFFCYFLVVVGNALVMLISVDSVPCVMHVSIILLFPCLVFLVM